MVRSSLLSWFGLVLLGLLGLERKEGRGLEILELLYFSFLGSAIVELALRCVDFLSWVQSFGELQDF